MQLEEAINLGKYIESYTKGVLGIKHFSEVESGDDFTDFICLEIKHKSNDVEHDQKELYYILLSSNENDIYDLYSDIIFYLTQKHSEYFDIRLNMVVLKEVEAAVINIISNTIDYKQEGSVTVKLSFRFNDMFNRDILVLIKKDECVYKIKDYMVNNTFLNYKIEFNIHSLD